MVNLCLNKVLDVVYMLCYVHAVMEKIDWIIICYQIPR